MSFVDDRLVLIRERDHLFETRQQIDERLAVSANERGRLYNKDKYLQNERTSHA